MIRINLIPDGRRTAAAQGSAQTWVMLYLVSGLLTCVRSSSST